MNQSTNSTTGIWMSTNSISSNALNSGTIGTFTSNNTYPFSVKWYSKQRCRVCLHSHMEGQRGCMDVVGQGATFVKCSCKEYVPLDNLEYLEYLVSKKESK